MKLYRISRRVDRDPLNLPKGALRTEAVEETIALFSEVLLQIFRRNRIGGLHVSWCEGGKEQHHFKAGQAVSLDDIPELVNLNMKDVTYTKIRDSSCRFIDFGMNYLVNVCLKHEDEIAVDAWVASGVVVDDISLRLIETDAYDL